MRQVIRVVFTLLVLSAGVAAAPKPASAATAVPWRFAEIQVSGRGTGDVALTAYCPTGFIPISGGVLGTGIYTVLHEYATYSDNSFSALVHYQSGGSFYTLFAQCAEADQIGQLQVIGADFAADSSSGLAGGWVACPTGTRAVGGGADWNMASTREIDYFAVTDDDGGWYATGKSSAAGDSLHVEVYCVASDELAGAQLVKNVYTDPASGTILVSTCPSGTRILTGGIYAAVTGSDVNPGVFVGQMQNSYPHANVDWLASTPNALPAGSTVSVNAWCVPASIPTIVINSGPPAVTSHTSADFSFTGSDPVGYPLTYSCSLDGLGSPCDSQTGTGYFPVSEGAHSFTVSVTNPDGERASATYNWTVDTTAPTVAATAPAQPFTLESSAIVSWTGQDNTGGTGLARYQVRERTAPFSSGFKPWTYPSAWQALNPATTSVTASGLARGRDYCFAVRAVDKAGNTSPWTTPRCIARPLDDRALSVGKGWIRRTGSRYWNGTITVTSAHGATARLTGAKLDQVGIVATRGPAMGTIAVYVGATQIGQISLAATSTSYQNLILLPPFSYRTGTVTVKVVSRGKPVQIDGLALSPN
jgi:hypothetical protein